MMPALIGAFVFLAFVSGAFSVVLFFGADTNDRSKMVALGGFFIACVVSTGAAVALSFWALARWVMA